MWMELERVSFLNGEVQGFFDVLPFVVFGREKHQPRNLILHAKNVRTCLVTDGG